MFIGHFAVGFASKRAAPKASLGLLMAAPLFLDLLWPILLALKIESVRIVPGDTAFTPLDLHDFPWSHSLLMSVVWSGLAAFACWSLLRQIRTALVVAAGVFSHYVLDLVTHRPDLPLYPGSGTLWGLGLWNSVPGTLVVESVLFAAGVAIYLKTTRPRSKAGTISLVALVGLLSVVYVADRFSPPPPSVNALIGVGFAAWLFVPWAWYIDRKREVVAG